MKNLFLSLLLLFSINVFAQLPPADFPDGADGKKFGLYSNTQSEIDNWTFVSGVYDIAYNVTTGELLFYDGTEWICISCNSDPQTLQSVIAQDAIATSAPNFQGGVYLGNSSAAFIIFNSGGSLVTGTGLPFSLSVPTREYVISKNNTNVQNHHVVSQGNNYNANTNVPALSNSDTGVTGVEYRVTVAGTQDFGNGPITFAVNDLIGNDGTEYYKKVDNNQTGGSTSPPSTGNTFSGEMNLTNYLGVHYNPYDLSSSGQITFSIASSPLVSAFCYIPIDSDGVTEFATKPNLDSIFDEQYNVPSDRILPEGVHYLYVLKNPRTGKASLSIPANLYNPDVTAPEVESATITNDSPDELIVVHDEPVYVTNTTGLSLDNDLSGLTIDSIISGNGTDTVTYQLSGDADAGDAGDFVYSGSNTVEDLSGNALASGDTAVTNNVVGALAYTLAGFTESSNEFTATTSAYGSSYAVSTIAYSGAFDYEIEIENANSVGSMIGISSTGTNRTFNDGTPWRLGVYITGVNTIRKHENGTVADVSNQQTATYQSGDILKISRDGSNIVTAYYNGILLHTFSAVTGDLYLHFSMNTTNNKIYNPTYTQN